MATEIDICNLALSHLGDEATVSSISPPEGSSQAEHCARFYPIARNALLELRNWKFATKRAQLAELSTHTYGWGFAYAEPNKCLRVLSILDAESKSDAISDPFMISTDDDGTKVILTDMEYATALYTVLIEDTTQFSPLFTDALSRLLASYLAGPVIKGDAGKAEAKAQYQAFLLVIGQAGLSDANQRNSQTNHVPEWIGGR